MEYVVYKYVFVARTATNATPTTHGNTVINSLIVYVGDNRDILLYKMYFE
jgi:hypothetical protein